MRHWRLRPYEFYKTPNGVNFRYAPLNAANVNIGENLQRSAQIETNELSQAKQRATDKFYDIELKVQELVRQAELPQSD